MKTSGMLAGMIILLLVSPAFAQSPLGTAFTYQGQLHAAGNPVTASADFEFTLWDAGTAGTQIGNVESRTNVSVNDGLFTVDLDFGEAALNGQARWLQVAVRSPSGSGDFTTLAPRQRISATPYAVALPALRTLSSGNPAQEGSAHVLAGHADNTVASDAAGVVVAGGGAAGQPNAAQASFTAIGGGWANVAVGSGSVIGGGAFNQTLDGLGVIGGGNNNTTDGTASTAGGGSGNTASGHYSTVAGGQFNTASGTASTVPGGSSNIAAGLGSFAAGYTAEALHDGAFVWSCAANEFASTGADQFLIQATGGVGVGTNAPSADLHIVGNTTQNTVLVESPNTAGTWLTLFNSATSGRAWSIVSTGNGRPEGPGHLMFRDTVGGGADMILTSSGKLGIGTTNPGAPLTAVGASTRGDQLRLVDEADTSRFAALGVDDLSNFYIQTHQGGVGAVGDVVLQGGFPDGAYAGGNVGIGVTDPQARLHVAGRTRTDVLEIVGGSDIAEPFEVAEAERAVPGMVVCIDAAERGKLRLADRAYDATVAGVISGAGGVRPGLTLRQEGTIADGSHPIALTGRVYCYVDADAGGPVRPGDLLTTSNTPGHAMKAVDADRSRGAVLGKAMTALDSGRGLVLVLVALQ